MKVQNKQSETTTKQENNEVVPVTISGPTFHLFIWNLTAYLLQLYTFLKIQKTDIVVNFPPSRQFVNSDFVPDNLLSHIIM